MRFKNSNLLEHFTKLHYLLDLKVTKLKSQNLILDEILILLFFLRTILRQQQYLNKFLIDIMNFDLIIDALNATLLLAVLEVNEKTLNRGFKKIIIIFIINLS